MSDLRELLVPYGCPEVGPLVRAEDAVAAVRYSCPQCFRELQLRALDSDYMRQHFYHPTPTTCTRESVIHATAKRLIFDLIQDNAAGECDSFRMHLPCESCGVVETHTPEGGYYSGAEEEHAVGAYVCDVVGLTGKDVRLAVEVLHTHAMPGAKVENLSCRWIEVVAGDVLKEPTEWRAVRAGLGKGQAFRCSECLSGRRRPLVTSERVPPGTDIIRFLSTRVALFANAEEDLKAWDEQERKRQAVNRWLRNRKK